MRIHPNAEVVPLGERRLAEYVTALVHSPADPPGKLFILDISRQVRQEPLLNAVRLLERRNCDVHCYSFDESCTDAVREGRAVVQGSKDRSESLCEATAVALGMEEAEDLTDLVQEENWHASLQSALLLECAAFSYSRTRSIVAYADVVRFLAERGDCWEVLPSKMDRLLRHYRDSQT